MFKHDFSDYESSDTLSRHAHVQHETECFTMQGIAEVQTRPAQVINVQGGRTMLIAPAVHPFNRDKSRHQKLLKFAREYNNLRVRDLVNTL
jgi:hypothetical protein